MFGTNMDASDRTSPIEKTVILDRETDPVNSPHEVLDRLGIDPRSPGLISAIWRNSVKVGWG